MSEIIHGACLCKAVRFEITPPTRFCGHCHCSMCRRSHGAALVTWSGVPDEQLSITAGEALLTHYASSPEATRSFCSRCGTQLFYSSTRWPGQTSVATAALLDPPDELPSYHVFYSDRARWFRCEDDLPRCGGSTGVEPLE